MKKLLFSFLFFIGILSFSQEVKMKGKKLSIDNKEVFSYEREDFGVYQIHFYDLKSNDEILFIKKNDNETPRYFDDDYTQIKFISIGKSLEIKQDKSWKGYVEWLLKNKVLDNEGKLNEEMVDKLIKNYDEKITDRTVR